MNISLDSSFERLSNIFKHLDKPEVKEIEEVEPELFDEFEDIENDVPHEPTSHPTPTNNYHLDLTQVD